MEFRGGPLAGQMKHVESEPEEEFEVPAEEGGPFTYVRVASVGAEESAEPIRVIFDPEQPMVSQHENLEETLAKEPFHAHSRVDEYLRKQAGAEDDDRSH